MLKKMVGKKRGDEVEKKNAPPTKRKSDTSSPTPAQNGINGHLSQQEEEDTSIDRVVSKDMAYYCFEVLLNHLKKKDSPYSKYLTFTNDAYPLFVTWQIGPGKRLRGCIGTFTASKLHDALKEYSLISGLRDGRFSPISLREVEDLHCSVSVLTNFENDKTHQDWEVGVHGISIEFHDSRGRRMTATYLPEVAKEQGWTKREAIDSLIRKAGYHKTISDEIRHSIKLTRYRSEKLSVSYVDFCASL